MLFDVRNALYDKDGYGLDAVGMGVLLLLSRKHAPNAKARFYGRLQAWIIGPHYGERL